MYKKLFNIETKNPTFLWSDFEIVCIWDITTCDTQSDF